MFRKDCSEVTLCKSVPAKSLEQVGCNTLPPNSIPLTNTVTKKRNT